MSSNVTSFVLSTLRDELDLLLGELDAVLIAENTALRQRDSLGLEHAAALKLELLERLETTSGNYCRAGGNLADPELSSVRVRAATCMRANRINGGAIELNRNLVGRLLDTLRGGTRLPAVYDASGRVQQRELARPVGYA